MKKVLYLMAGLVAGLIVSCKPAQVESTLTLTSSDKETVAVGGGEVTITFSTNTNWRASTTSSDWARVKPAQGEAGDQTVTVTVAENGTTDERTATVNIATTDGKKVSVAITQAAANTMGISKTSYEIGAEGGTIDVLVTTNMTFKVESKVDWITAPTKAIPDVTSTLTVAPNTEISSREGEVVFSAEGQEPVTVTVSQAAFEPLLAIEGETVLPKEGGEFRFTVQSNCEWMVVLDVPEELEEVYINAERAGDEIVLEIQENEAVGARQFTLGVTATDYEGIYAAVEIRQDGIADVAFNVGLLEMGFSTEEDVNQRMRLAYVDGKLLASTQDQVVVVNPETGAKEGEFPVGDAPHLSIVNDDAGHAIFAGQYAEGEEITLFSTASASTAPELALSLGTAGAGTTANFRVRGDIAGKAFITAMNAAGPSNPAKILMAEIEGGKLKGEAQYIDAPLPGMWSPYFGVVMPVGPSLADGLLYTGYAGDKNLYHSGDATAWSSIIDLQNVGNDCCNTLDVVTMGGKTYVAIGVGAYFSWSNTRLEIYDITNPSAAEQILSLGAPLRRADYTNAYASADVLMLPAEDGKSLTVFFAELGRDSLAKVVVPIK